MVNGLPPWSNPVILCVRPLSGTTEKQPPSGLADFVAAIVRTAFVYMEAIFADSLSQSVLSSWIIQRESIHKYLNPRRRTNVIVSWKVLGIISHGIFLFRRLSDPRSVLSICDLPQQWLRATYNPVSPLVSYNLTWGACGPGGSTSRMRVGNLASEFEYIRHWWWFSKQSCSHLSVCWRLALEEVSSG